ncbi:MAG: PTS sugar transporter subunit IIA [Anaerolineaceae bacterium]|nr:PTS sugar transporter subunit IIA [Anaerolineaceae bacterium]
MKNKPIVENGILDFIHQDIIVLGMNAVNSEDAIRQLGSIMFQKGYVKESYVDAVIAREKNFPTGLPTEEVKVAIPHTDTEHTLKPAIGVAVLKKPVQFFELATTDVPVQAEIIFLLSIVQPSEQVKWLQRLVTLFQRSGFLTQIKQSVNCQSCFQFLVRDLDELRLQEEKEEMESE